MTFTKAATIEMEERAAKMMPAAAPGENEIWIATQHSWALKFLRSYSGLGSPTLLGCADLRHRDSRGKKRYPLLTDGFYMEAWKKSAQVAGIREDQLPHYRAARIVSRAKNTLVTQEQLSASKNSDHRCAAQVWSAYTEFCMLNKKIDFDDVLVETATLLEESGVSVIVQTWHPWVLVDECQDLSPVQWKIINLMCPPPDYNLTIVGDDDQSIYGFRGAEPSKLINFENLYTDAKVVKLEQNYRSTTAIVDQATTLIKHNEERQDKTPYSVVEHERDPMLMVLADDNSEGEAVRMSVEKWIELGYNYGDMAILVRCWWQTRPFEEALLYASIPYAVWGGAGFYARREINALTRYFRLAIDPYDPEALLADSLARSILNMPLRFLSKAAWRTLSAYCKANQISAYDALCQCQFANSWMAGGARELHETIDILHDWVTANKVSSADILRQIEAVLDFENYLMGASDKSEDHIDNVRALTLLAENHPDPAEFIEHILKMAAGQGHRSPTKDAVQILTIHRAKGREWPCVAAVGFADGVLPHAKASRIAEERRLAYVAVTRAERELLVTAASFYGTNPADLSPFVSQLGFDVEDVKASDE
jgi:DNA helicase-2/ATP-dependent DNA helicase PcrA